MILRLVLGALLAAMAAGQLLSFDAMPGILTAYGLTDGAASAVLAGALIAGEAVAGAWFLARPRSTTAAPAWIYTAVSLVWALLAFQAYTRGLTIDNCGCFGRYATQSLRWYVLVEDALMLLYAWLLLRARCRSATGPVVSPAPQVMASPGKNQEVS